MKFQNATYMQHTLSCKREGEIITYQSSGMLHFPRQPENLQVHFCRMVLQNGTASFYLTLVFDVKMPAHQYQGEIRNARQHYSNRSSNHLVLWMEHLGEKHRPAPSLSFISQTGTVSSLGAGSAPSSVCRLTGSIQTLAKCRHRVKGFES